MNGALWAGVSGVAFGVFQVLNARAVRDLTRVYVATFVQLLAATVVFAAIVAATGDLAAVADLPLDSAGWFALAGMVHFFVGWTTLNASQARIGAARTSPLTATSPIFGVLVAVATTGRLPSPLAMLGIAVTVVGAYLVTDPGPHQRASLRDSSFALVTSAAWGSSAVLTVAGLAGFADPLMGVTVGMAAATVAYGVLLLVVPGTRGGAMDRTAWTFKLVAGLVVAVATWWRWLGLADASVGVVLALQLLAVPTVLLIVAVGQGVERITPRVWLGAATVVLGVGLLIGMS